MGLFVYFTKQSYCYTKWHAESKTIGLHIWKWTEMAVFGEYLQKMTDSARRFKITVKHILMTDYFTKSSEEFNKIGYKCCV